MMRRMLWTVCVVAAWLGSAFGAAAKNPVSPAFDGDYIPRVTAVPGMTGPQCQAFTAAPLTISKGNLMSSGLGSILNGIVTTDGFVTGFLIRPNAPRLVFEGRFVDGAFSGAVVENGCAWTITFEKGAAAAKAAPQKEP